MADIFAGRGAALHEVDAEVADRVNTLYDDMEKVQRRLMEVMREYVKRDDRAEYKRPKVKGVAGFSTGD